MSYNNLLDVSNLYCANLNSHGNMTISTAGQLWINRGVKYQANTISTDTTLDNSYIFVFVSGTAGPITVTLPSSAGLGDGFMLWIKDQDGSAVVNTITIAASGPDTIDGAGSVVINLAYGSKILASTSSGWAVF